MNSQIPFWLLTGLASMAAMSIDMYLPSLSMLQKDFGASWGSVQSSVTAFLFSFAGAQLFAGPLSDRLGRRRVVLGGLALFVLGCMLAAVSPNLELFLVARVLQGCGACVGQLTTFALVRDLLPSKDRAAVLAKVFSAVALVPVLSPLLGGQLQVLLSWRTIFVFLAGYAVLLFLYSRRYFPSAAPAAQEVPSQGHEPGQGYGRILREPKFLLPSLTSIASFCALFSYICLSARLFQKDFGLSPNGYAVFFAVNSIALLLGGRLSAFLVKRNNVPKTMALGIGLILSGGVFLLSLSSMTSPPLLGVVLAAALATVGVGLTMSNGLSMALEPFGKAAGTASAVQGFTKFAGAGLVSWAVSFPAERALPVLAGAIIVCALVSLSAFSLFRLEQREVKTC